jgi:uncharacterized damage-inducible protein DinB
MPGNAAPVTDETELLLAYLEQQRAGIRNAAYGLTEDQIRLSPAASVLTIAGLIKHVAATEQYWIDLAARASSEPVPATAAEPAAPGEDDQDRSSAYADTFRVGPDDRLAGLVDRYAEVARHTTEAVAAIGDLDSGVPVPTGVPWFPEGATWTLRWILLHVIEETARHAGHADIIRESIDGATMYELMAAAEGWPPTDWLKPWRPPA